MELGVGLGGFVAVEIGLGDAPGVQLLDPTASPIAQLVDRPELDRGGRAGLGAGRDKAIPLAVVTKCALVRVAVEVAPGDDPERAGRDAVRAAVADVALNVNVLKFVINDSTGGARVLARGGHAVLAHVAHHQPATGPAPVEQLVERQLVAWFAGPGRIVVRWACPFEENCSMNFTCRHEVAESSAVLS